MKNLIFFLKYKTIKNNHNNCTGCELSDNCAERNCTFIDHPSCYRKTFKKRDYEKIIVTIFFILCAIYLLLLFSSCSSKDPVFIEDYAGSVVVEKGYDNGFFTLEPKEYFIIKKNVVAYEKIYVTDYDFYTNKLGSVLCDFGMAEIKTFDDTLSYDECQNIIRQISQ